MSTFNGRKAYRSLIAARFNLPVEKTLSEVLPEREKINDNEADPTLLCLPAPGLTGLVDRVGWNVKDVERRVRHQEEYRMQKVQSEISAALVSPSIPTMGGMNRAGDGNSVAGTIILGNDVRWAY